MEIFQVLQEEPHTMETREITEVYHEEHEAMDTSCNDFSSNQMINNGSTIAMMSGQMERQLNGPVMDMIMETTCLQNAT